MAGPLGFVAANAFKDGGAVAHDVGEDVEGGVVPIDPLSVVPDFIGLLDGHDGLLDGASAVLSLKLQNTVCGGERQLSVRLNEYSRDKNQFGAWCCANTSRRDYAHTGAEFRRVRRISRLVVLRVGRGRAFLLSYGVVGGLRFRQAFGRCLCSQSPRRRNGNDRGRGPEFGVARNFGFRLPAEQLGGYEEGKHGPRQEREKLGQELGDRAWRRRWHAAVR